MADTLVETRYGKLQGSKNGSVYYWGVVRKSAGRRAPFSLRKEIN
jgi:hypothetical protein